MHLTATVVLCNVSYLLIVIVLPIFSLVPLGLVSTLLSSTPSSVYRTFLDNVDFHSIRIATLLTSGLAVGSIARSSVVLIVVSFFYRSFVELIIDLDYYSL